MECEKFSCLYCGLEKTLEDASLEHAVPQFMGGDFAPEKYFLRNVCGKCNNNLGLFVDASYAKSWFVHNQLVNAAHDLYTGLNNPPIPLMCLGDVSIEGLSVPDEDVVECWLGPSGETIIWIRKNDDRMYWYSGGNPIDSKKKASVAYLNLTSEDPTRWRMGVASFQAAFKGRKARKILCTELHGAPDGAVLPGFDTRTPEDEANVLAIRSAINSGVINGKIAVNTKFDLRFISKLVLGVGYSLFGDPFLTTDLAREARKGCWPRDGSFSEIRGSSSLMQLQDPTFSGFVGYPSAVSFFVLPVGPSYAMTVSVNQGTPFTVELAPTALESEHVHPEFGYVMLLFPHLKRVVELTVTDLLAHALGGRPHPELADIDEIRRRSTEFYAQLGPVEPENVERPTTIGV